MLVGDDASCLFAEKGGKSLLLYFIPFFFVYYLWPPLNTRASPKILLLKPFYKCELPSFGLVRFVEKYLHSCLRVRCASGSPVFLMHVHSSTILTLSSPIFLQLQTPNINEEEKVKRKF